MNRLILSLLAASLLAACASKPALIRVADVPKTGEVFEGVPMRLKTEQVVQVWRLNPEKNKYEQVMESRQTLADQTRLYALNVKTGLFASPGLKITQYADNTPKSIQVTSSQNAAGAIDAATTVATGIGAARSGAATAANSDANACQAARAALNAANTALTTAQKAHDEALINPAASAELKEAYAQAVKDAQAATAFARNHPQC